MHDLPAPLLPDEGLPRGAAVDVADAALLIQLAATTAGRPSVFTAVSACPTLASPPPSRPASRTTACSWVDDPANQYVEVIAPLAPI
ncbi:hypothetical protein [Kitasatospora sp. KL5]|uniref:hypothetical protein n=1 Tax=Kitasatospora sp. KL5 TaxID=3425125 RepID=UPI003D6F25F8